MRSLAGCANMHILLTFTAIIYSLVTLCNGAKVLDLGQNLPELIENNPEKGWLVKFYAPWCHHCQQLEPTYINAAGIIYQTQDNVIVGRVDCTVNGPICEQYAIDSYPTIIYLSKGTSAKYKGDRTKESIVSFSARQSGPTIRIVNGCAELQEAVDRHELLVVSTIRNTSSELKQEYENFAESHKSSHWFFQLEGNCQKLEQENLYLMKKYLDRPIEFVPSTNESESQGDQIKTWLLVNSFPIFGQISQRNIERALSSGRLIVLAILEEYRPVKKLLPSSHDFYKGIKNIAIKYCKKGDQVLFGWMSDVNLIEYITVWSVSTPNLMILKQDLSYKLILDRSKESDQADTSTQIDDLRLIQEKLDPMIKLARAEKLDMSGGSSYIFSILRLTVGNFNRLATIYRANPLLVSLLLGFPGLIIALVIYTTCCYESTEDEDELQPDDDDEEREPMLGNGHLKQE